MINSGKFIIAFLAMLMPVWQCHALQQDPDVIWYEGFFKSRHADPVETQLIQSLAKIQKADEASDMKAKVKALNESAFINLTRARDYDKAMDLFFKALAIEDSLDLKQEQAMTYLGIAHVFEEVGDFDESAEALEQALKSNETANNIPLLALLSNKLGRINAARGRIDDALDNYDVVLKYKDQLDAPVEADALFNIAHAYSIRKEYDTALDFHKQALIIRRRQRDRADEARSLNEIAEVYHVMKNDDKAMANHNISLKIRKSLNDKASLAESFNNIGVLYFEQKNYRRAVANLLLGLDAGQDSQDQNQMTKSYEYLSLSYNELKDYRNALKYKELHQAIHDFIQQDKNERRLSATQKQYVIGQKESQIGKLEIDREKKEREIEDQKKFRNILIALIAMALIIVALVFYLYVLKRQSNQKLQEANEKVSRQNVQLQQLNATKDKFFSILGHDLKGPLNSLTSFSGLLINHTDSLSKDEIRTLAKDLDKSLKNLFTLLENLLEWSRSQTGNIEFKPEPFDLAEVLEQNKELLKTQAQAKNIAISNVSKAGIIISAHRHSINTVVRNLVSNAIKFTPEGGAVTLNAQMAKDEVMISVSDTGVGMSDDIITRLFRIDTKHSTKGTADEKGTGLGLILCKEFVEKNGGRIGVQSEIGQGSVFYFTLPV